MTAEEVRQTIRRVFLIFDGEKAWLQDDRAAAQAAADSGKLTIEYGYIGRLKGVNDVMVPIKKED